jgi:hypothetical protein
MALLDNFKAYINSLMRVFQERIKLAGDLNWEKAVRELVHLREKTLPLVNRKYNSASQLSSQYTESTLVRLEESIIEYINRISSYLMKTADQDRDKKAGIYSRLNRLLSPAQDGRLNKIASFIDNVLIEFFKISSKESGALSAGENF